MQEIEINIEQAKEAIELFDCLNRLRENNDFKKLIEEGYFKDEACRLVLIRGEDSMKEVKDDILRDIDGIASFHAYLRQVYASGFRAKDAMAEMEATRDEIAQEEL